MFSIFFPITLLLPDISHRQDVPKAQLCRMISKYSRNSWSDERQHFFHTDCFKIQYIFTNQSFYNNGQFHFQHQWFLSISFSVQIQKSRGTISTRHTSKMGGKVFIPLPHAIILQDLITFKFELRHILFTCIQN